MFVCVEARLPGGVEEIHWVSVVVGFKVLREGREPRIQYSVARLMLARDGH